MWNNGVLKIFVLTLNYCFIIYPKHIASENVSTDIDMKCGSRDNLSIVNARVVVSVDAVVVLR